MYRYIIDSERPCIIITSKADKIAVTKVDSQVRDLQEQLNPLKDLTFIPFSTERKIYTEKAWEEIEKFIGKEEQTHYSSFLYINLKIGKILRQHLILC